MKLKALTTGMFAIAAIAVAVMAGAGATTASFSDRVTSNGNTFKAGTLQLQMGSTACANPGNRTYGGVPGNLGVDGNSGCTVAGGATYSSSTAMKPGDTSSATYSIKNIGSLSGTLSVGTTSWSVTAGGKGTCTVSPSNFTISSTYNPTSVGATSTASVPVTGSVPTSSADGCQGTTFTASVPFRMNGASATGFSDLLTSTGNTFTMTSLVAPTNVQASPTGPTAATVSWTNPDFATAWNIYRHTGTCTGWTTPGVGDVQIATNTTANPFPDSGLTAGTSYCYAVQGVFHNWLSPFATGGATTTLPNQKLYINNSPTNTLVTSGQTGTFLLGGKAPSPNVWTAVPQTNVSTGGGWTLSFDVTSPATQPNAMISFYIWLSTTSTCASTPVTSGTSLIASTTVDFSPLTAGVYSLPLTINNAAPTPFAGGTGLICLGAVSGNNGQPHTLTITADSNSFISGPFTVVP